MVKFACFPSSVTHYELPMDEIRAQRLVNPSGLDAMAYGSPALHEGIRSRAVALDGKDKYVKVSGQAHRSECFGDLDLCTSGEHYSLSDIVPCCFSVQIKNHAKDYVNRFCSAYLILAETKEFGENLRNIL